MYDLEVQMYARKCCLSYLPPTQVRVITVFTVFRLLTDFVCLYNYEFWLSLCKIARSSVILLLPPHSRVREFTPGIRTDQSYFLWLLYCLLFDLQHLVASLDSSDFLWKIALKSYSTHHFFRNACTKSGSLRFSQFSGCWLILSVYIIMSFDFPLDIKSR
jgi:hypothetical protein